MKSARRRNGITVDRKLRFTSARELLQELAETVGGGEGGILFCHFMTLLWRGRMTMAGLLRECSAARTAKA